MSKIVMGPTQLVLDHNEYPVTFAVLSAIKAYNETCAKAQSTYQGEVANAQKKLEKAQAEALDLLKGSLQ